MLKDTIRKYRKEKGFSQEEMAESLHVVRQTVSKWENGLSVPDAEMLVRVAAVLNVSVHQLLEIHEETDNTDNVTRQLEALNQELTRKKQQEKIAKCANQKRGLILFLSFLSMVISFCADSPIVSLVLAGSCVLIAVIVLYRNLEVLTRVTAEDMKLPILRITTLFDIVILVIGIVVSVLVAADKIRFSEQGEKVFAMLLIACVMLFSGIISPRLPFTRHTGLRLPWTVRDEDTWNLAHRVLGMISFPLALLYIACSLTVPCFESVTFLAILLWIGLPGGISLIYFLKKMHGKL